VSQEERDEYTPPSAASLRWSLLLEAARYIEEIGEFPTWAESLVQRLRAEAAQMKAETTDPDLITRSGEVADLPREEQSQ
jgi:hypothetical protein